MHGCRVSLGLLRDVVHAEGHGRHVLGRDLHSRCCGMRIKGQIPVDLRVLEVQDRFVLYFYFFGKPASLRIRAGDASHARQDGLTIRMPPSTSWISTSTLEHSFLRRDSRYLILSWKVYKSTSQ